MRDRKQIKAKRSEPLSSFDPYPTPEWATRAFIRMAYQLQLDMSARHICLDPCVGDGAMARVLESHFDVVWTNDIVDYGYRLDYEGDYLSDLHTIDCEPDWIVMNPPFNLAMEFIDRACDHAQVGVATFARLQLLEGGKRYIDLWSRHPPAYVLPFVHRVDCTREQKGSALAFAWYLWQNGQAGAPRIHWITDRPPKR